MHFPVSGVDCPIWLPPAAAFIVALVTAPAGISGAFLLLPFQMSVLGFVTPAVTPTNLIYNTVATPGGVYRYIVERRMAWALAWTIVLGTLPGVFVGAFIRIRYLPDPRRCKFFVGLVLLGLGLRLVRDVFHGPPDAPPADQASGPFGTASLVTVSLIVGLIGGIYGVGGGAIIAPYLMAILGLSAYAVAGAALFGTFLTSIAGVISFELLGRTALASGAAVHPDWTLGLLFGIGGLCGSYCGARLQKHLPERWIRLMLAVLLLSLALAYTTQFFVAKTT